MTVISEHAISPARLRHALGHFATGVTVITSVSAEGEPVGTTVSAVSSVSLDPPLVLVINILSEGQQRLSSNFARRGAAVSWDAVAHRRGHAGCPRLEGALAVLDCTLEQRLEGGDHEIVIGRVRELELSARERGPLLHYRGVYVSLAPA